MAGDNTFIADFHVHSYHSRATARNMDLENLYVSAQLKGITVIGTGDFTHPGWVSELKEKLVFCDNGLFKLKPDIARVCDEKVPLLCRSQVFFMLTTEISNIYKKKGKTRKNHNLIFVPDLHAASRISSKLASIGNLESDGRPILGLDAKNLLDILLKTTDRGFFVPAHIWTPWFSLLGSKSGFNSVQDCFEDLTPHICALETGLSSDPPMNRRVSQLDRFTLISNSDAHSPSKLGREANIFDTDLNYDSIVDAMKSGNPDHFLGTLEFYPEEGKYHHDGHRKCDIVFDPEQTRLHNNICPVCKKPLTLGVLNRVDELSDRPQGFKPEKKHFYIKLTSLVHVLSEIYGMGPASKKVLKEHRSILEKLGPELNVLKSIPLKKIEKEQSWILKESIKRMRENDVQVIPGFDGKFGRVKIFRQGELDV